MEEFLNNFKNLFEDKEAESMTMFTPFRNLEEWDSIMGLSVIGMIDDEYGVEFNADDMKKCHIVKDIYDLVLQKQ